jgi:predicted N-acetyltransferase YhbS
MAEVTFEWIEGPDAEDEPRMDVIQAKIIAQGWTPLNYHTSRVRAAYDEEGKLIGFGVFQSFPMTGPLWVDPDYRGTGIAETLADDMARFLRDAQCRGYIVIADNPHSERLCKLFGMKKIDSPVYLMPEGKA